jgi:hypothetical protein
MRNALKYGFWLLALGGLLSSCQDVVDLDLPEGDRFLVVEGWITNENRPHDVILTYTAAYFDDADPTPVIGATVFLRDDEGMETVLDETSPGIYTYPDSGVVGRSYQLEILLENGERYISKYEFLEEPAPILDIYWQLSEDEPDPDNGENPDDIYDVLIFAIEPEGLGDHYRWRSILNGVEQREPFDIFVTDDQFVDGNPIPEFNVTEDLYSLNDTVTIIQERISRDAFEFLSLLQQQTAFVGGPFDPPPAPIRGNIRNINDPDDLALGFFGASARDRATTIVGVE